MNPHSPPFLQAPTETMFFAELGEATVPCVGPSLPIAMKARNSGWSHWYWSHACELAVYCPITDAPQLSLWLAAPLSTASWNSWSIGGGLIEDALPMSHIESLAMYAMPSFVL
jgi:hypothetical protein